MPLGFLVLTPDFDSCVPEGESASQIVPTLRRNAREVCVVLYSHISCVNPILTVRPLSFLKHRSRRVLLLMTVSGRNTCAYARTHPCIAENSSHFKDDDL